MEFIYIGSGHSCQTGAIGTHTQGIIKGFLKRTDKFNSFYLIDNDIDCFKNNPIYNDLKIIQPQFSQSNSFVGKIWSFRRRAKSIAEQVYKLSDSKKYIYHRYDFALSFFLIKFLKKKGVNKVVLEYNDLLWDQLVFAKKKKQWSTINGLLRVNFIAKYLVKIIEGFCFKNTNLVVGVTDKIVEHIKTSHPGSNAIVVQNAIGEDIITENKTKSVLNIREKIGWPKDKIIMSHVGTLTHWDGLLELLNAFAHVRDRNIFHLYIVGQGALEERIKNKILELDLNLTVSLLPRVPHAKALEYVLASDVIPLLKTIDSYQLSPIKFYEALGLGKYLIVTDVDYINSVQDMGFGKVVSIPLVESEIVHVLNEVEENIKDIRDQRKAIIAYAEQHLSWSARIEQILQHT